MLLRVLGALFYRSLPLCSPCHSSQQAADLVFEPAMKRLQKPNFEHNFLTETRNEKKELHELNITYVWLSKKTVAKIADFSLKFFFKLQAIILLVINL